MQILLPNTAPDMTICKKFQYCRRVKKRSILSKKNERNNDVNMQSFVLAEIAPAGKKPFYKASFFYRSFPRIKPPPQPKSERPDKKTGAFVFLNILEFTFLQLRLWLQTKPQKITRHLP